MDKDLGPAAVVALAADLLLGARIRGGADATGVAVELARDARALLARVRTAPPRRILLDLDTRGADPVALIRTLKADPATAAVEIVAFVSHVREDAMAAARAAGADRVLARGAFLRQLPTWLRTEA